LIFALCGYGLWYYVSTGERDRPERVSAVPADLAALPGVQAGAAPSLSPSATDAKAAEPAATAPATIGGPGAAAPAPPPSAVATAAPAPAASPPTPAMAAANPGTGAAPAVTPPATAVTPPSAAGAAVAAAPSASVPPAATQGRVYGAEGGVSRIVIEVTKDSWLQIRDGDRVLLDKVLHPGDSYRVGDRSGLVMRTGNAAGLDIEVDGHRTPPIKGTVRNQIALDPDRLVAGTAAAN
jgi:hypothetical protein